MDDEKTHPSKSKTNHQGQSKTNQGKFYLKYSLLVDLMHLLKKYGRSDLYEFSLDEKLSVIKSGFLDDVITNEKIKQILSFNSFISIWLLTLPEKFKEWFDNHNKDGLETRATMSFTEQPTFATFEDCSKYTMLAKN